ncbi:MAG TPA: hypothetical protein VK302_20105 [Terriglobales bacterium]|nr:hypothetical protein [Terriglobales bacterium]
MKQNAGIIAALTVFLAFVGLSNLPKGTPNSGGTETKTESNARTNPKKNGEPAKYAACEEIRDRLQHFVNQATPDDWRLPDSCYLGKKAPTNSKPMSVPPGVHFVIATAPNPISTHLPLLFDRTIEIIQQAAQDDNYSYDSSWFPWNDASKEYPLLGDQQAADQAQKIQQEQPGVVVFRRALKPGQYDSPYLGGLVVFVVAEQPTGGINQEAFDNALTWIQQLGALTPQRGLRILGPVFSGSLPSLALALGSRSLAAFAQQKQIYVLSGGVSSELGVRWFKEFLDNSGLGTFETAMEGDSLMAERLCKYLKVKGYRVDRLAMVSEDETAFGADDAMCYDPNFGGPIHLYYPRDIAALRSAYEQQSIFRSGKQQSPGNTVSTTLRGDLSEPASSDHDTVRNYGGQLTPLAQESVLLNLVNVLKEKKIEFVLLRSTNSLDQIFLTQFLRRAYPGARIVIDGADLLFERGAEGSSLRGVMVLSTYPLLAWQQDWTSSMLNGNNGSYRIFGEDVAEGLYVAARDLFRDRTWWDATVPINNYAAPTWALAPNETGAEERPATWISVIGHHQFWPVAVLNSYTLNNHDPSGQLPTAAGRGDEPVYMNGDGHPLRLNTELVILLIVCSVWCLLHFVWCWRGSILPFPSLFRLAHFAPVEKLQHPALIAFGSLLPAAIAVVTAATSGLFTWDLGGWRGRTLAGWTLSIIVVSFLACWNNYKLPGAPGKASATWQRRVGATALVVFGLFVLLRFRLIRNLTEADRIPLYWRSAHLLNGVSPLLPQLLLIAGMYLWFWFCLRGLALFGNDRPLLPKLDSLPTLDPGDRTSAMPMFSREKAAQAVEEQAIPVGKNYLQDMLPVTLFATGIVFALVLEDHALQTTGERLFGVVMFYWLSLCIAIILADTVQLWTTWRKLRPLLVYLDRLPLRRTLASLRGLSWGSVWAISGSTLEERYRVISRQFESLRHLGNLITAAVAEKSAPAKRRDDVLRRIEECQKNGRVFANWYVTLQDSLTSIEPLQKFQEELAATAGSVMKNVLLPAWQRETDSLIFDRTRADGNGVTRQEGGEAASPALPNSVPTYVLAAEEFFVLPYLGFIQNILGRMRTIILGSLFLFVAATFAVSSYPFDPLPVLGGVFLAVFLITGGTVIVVFAQMHRDATLSHITNTRPGELGGQFWLHLLTFGVGPLLGLLTALFPSITDFVSSWLQPSMQALK